MKAKLTTPTKFFVFVDLLLPISKHNLEVTSVFASAAWMQANTDSVFRQKYVNGEVDYFPFTQSRPDLNIVSPFCNSVANDYRVDYDAEVFRKRLAPLVPSRFSAIYAFGDFQSCELASRKYRWSLNQVREFTLIPDSLTRIHKANMEIISLARRAYRVGSIDASTRENVFWRNYWTGAGSVSIQLPNTDFNSTVLESVEIWEYLIEGQLKVIT